MVRALLLGVAIAVVFIVFSAIDCAMFPVLRIRGVRRWAWLLIILFIPVLGAALWWGVGRGRIVRTVAPDDDPAFLAELGKLLDEEHNPDSGGPAASGSSGPTG